MSTHDTAPPTVEPAGLDAIRARFPALRRRVAGRPVAYFDGPGGTQVPTAVADAVRDYLLEHNANTHWDYATSRETDALLAGAREAMADFIGGAASEIVFGANMTSLTYHLARGLGRLLEPGSRIVTTELEHHANIAPWRALAEERGLELRLARMDPASGTLDEEDMQAALTEKPVRLLAIGAASNALGTIPDVPRWAALARDAGGLVFVDAVHLAAHGLLDARALGADFIACSPYKFYGPHLGVLWGREELLEALPVPKLEPAPDSAPERLELGTLSHEGIVGAAAAVDFLASLGAGGSRRERLAAAFRTLEARGQALLARLWGGLEAIPGVRLYGPPPGTARTPTLSFTVDGLDPRRVAAGLDGEGLFLSHGDFYAQTVIRRLGRAPEGVVRAGCACYTSPEEVERLLDAVARLGRG